MEAKISNPRNIKSTEDTKLTTTKSVAGQGQAADAFYDWLVGLYEDHRTDSVMKNNMALGDKQLDLSYLISEQDDVTDFVFVDFNDEQSIIYVNESGAISPATSHNADWEVVVSGFDVRGGHSEQSDIIDHMQTLDMLIFDSSDKGSVS